MVVSLRSLRGSGHDESRDGVESPGSPFDQSDGVRRSDCDDRERTLPDTRRPLGELLGRWNERSEVDARRNRRLCGGLVRERTWNRRQDNGRGCRSMTRIAATRGSALALTLGRRLTNRARIRRSGIRGAGNGDGFVGRADHNTPTRSRHERRNQRIVRAASEAPHGEQRSEATKRASESCGASHTSAKPTVSFGAPQHPIRPGCLRVAGGMGSPSAWPTIASIPSR